MSSFFFWRKLPAAYIKRKKRNMTDYEKIYQYEHLYQAHKKARLGKQNKKEVILYEMFLTEHLERLSYQLKNHTYKISGYHKFTIYDPKEREIQALCYGDRIVQHSLCDNVLGPYLDKRLIYDNAACRIGKGTHFAIGRLSGFMAKYGRQYRDDGYILKCDIRKYFDSIDHDILKQCIRKMKLDKEVRELLSLIVDSYEKTPGKGIPMGNQTSQWFALYYLDGLDRLVKEKLGIKYYTRYMDDMIILHHDKEYLEHVLEQMSEYVQNERKLEFNQKTQIHSIKQGVDYLGFHFYLTDSGRVIKKLRQRNKKRIKKRLAGFKRLYQRGDIELDAIERSLNSYMGHLQHGDTWHLRRNICRNFVLKRTKRDK